MNYFGLNIKKISVAIFLLSISIIAYQLLLIHIFSITQWYHFAFMVISVALLGFGAAGSFIALFKNRLIANVPWLIPFSMLISGLLQCSAIFISQLSFARFDSYLIFADYSQFINLIITYLIFFLPFFFGAISIGLSFIIYIDQIGKLYFSNLIGSGLGGITALILYSIFLPEEISSLISLLPIISALILFPNNYKRIFTLIFILSIAVSVFFFINPSALKKSEFKSISKTLNLIDAKVVFTKNSPYGLIEVVSSPVLRYSQGLSLAYQKEVPQSKAIFLNGDWFGSIVKTNKGKNGFLHYTTTALPYAMKEKESVLILNAGSGIETAQAISYNANRITAVEQNGIIISLMKNEFAEDSDSLYHHKNLTIRNIDSRTFLQADTNKYDLITLPYTNSFGGGVGLYALQEQYLLTVDSFEEMFDHLESEGVISVSSWIDYPFRNPLKILSTIVEMLHKKKISDYKNHITAVKSWGTITFVVKKSPLNSEEIVKIRSFSDSLMFDPIILPDISESERTKYNSMQDEKFFEYIDEILSGHRSRFYDEYDFNIKPANDDQPYFSQFLKWKSLSYLKDIYGIRNAPFLEIGYLLVIITLIQIIIIAFVLIILPLFKTDLKGNGKLKTLLYFGAIGLGYMFVEIIFIQRFILYFGNIIYAAAAVISSMLICSGVGSYLSSKIKGSKRNLIFICGSIFTVLISYKFLLTPVLQSTIGFEFFLKAVIAFLLIAVPSFLMGMPFPIGLKIISAENKSLAAWAWGINGSSSVASSVLVVVLALEFGFATVILIAALSYFTAALTKVSFSAFSRRYNL
ncbi:MAG: hypothetical protein HY963_03560 [Ignavibacteriales bacterium]|nr:hypothetical protein [Ignavibacteriales bacterium]